MGFIDTTPGERMIIITILLVLLVIAGIITLFEKRKGKK